MGDWMHAVTAADPLIAQLNEGAEVHAPQPAGVLRWVLGSAGIGANAVYVLIHVRSGFLTAIPHARGPARREITRQLAACTRAGARSSAEAAEALERIDRETVCFDRQGLLLPEPVRRRIERALDVVGHSPGPEQAMAEIETLNELRLNPAFGRTPQLAWVATLEQVAASPLPQRPWWARLCEYALGSRR
ncbi:hypothetical protein LRF89_06085 [Halorhodospira sp. 9621]|uniref:hypothetical protein n=1 Tax=Halorhodospira sp. 9621 TaxID=2899135 RepID=UPI001EE9A85F|nr:hypothetical protein [Halorhodospira sp. 9621]MCG5533011.1 hypothetical protein [Halorhodospira sp. 9621]